MKMLRRSVLALLAIGALTPAHAQAQAQDYPNGTVKIIVPFSPGGATDTVARLIADQLQQMWKHPVIVEHKPGGGTTIGADFVAKSAPNGLTIGLVNSAFPLNPFLRKGMPYDTVKDFRAVTLIGGIHSALSARADAPFNNVKEMIAYAKANPGKLNYGLSAVGSLGHLTIEMIKRQEKIEILNVPFRGGSQVMTEMVAGRIDVASDTLLTMLPHVKSGKVKILGTLGDRRVAGYNFPTVAESLPGMSAESGTGLVVPAGTPDAIVRKIQTSVSQIVAQPAMKARLEELGIDPIGSTPEGFDEYLRAVSQRWGKLITDQRITLE